MLELLIALIVVGVVLYLIQLIPMDGTVKKIIMVIAVAILAIWAIETLLGAHTLLLR